MNYPLLTSYRIACSALVIACLSSPLAADHHGSFQKLFNGTSLENWDGDPRFWRVEEGELIGQTTAENKAERNTFLIYRGGEFADFELRFSYQVTGYNSGVQYRSVDLGDWNVTGYQADFEDRFHKTDSGLIDMYSGMFFDEQGRMFLGQRGEAVIVQTNPDNAKKPRLEVIGSTGDPSELEQAIHRDGWNDYRIIANGFQFTHIINDRVMAVGFDEDAENPGRSGILAFQLHSGPPMQIRLKDIRIRKIERD